MELIIFELHCIIFMSMILTQLAASVNTRITKYIEYTTLLIQMESSVIETKFQNMHNINASSSFLSPFTYIQLSAHTAHLLTKIKYSYTRTEQDPTTLLTMIMSAKYVNRIYKFSPAKTSNINIYSFIVRSLTDFTYIEAENSSKC